MAGSATRRVGLYEKGWRVAVDFEGLRLDKYLREGATICFLYG